MNLIKKILYVICTIVFMITSFGINKTDCHMADLYNHSCKGFIKVNYNEFISVNDIIR